MKKYFFIGVFSLLALAVIYHFYAANRAEKNIDKAIRELTAQSKLNFKVDYSSINVRPFTGNVVFSDINIIRDKNIQRATSARFDLTYSDFINFNFYGAESGLKSVKEGILVLKNLSYTNRTSLLEIKLDSLHVDYQGNLWNLIALGLTSPSTRIEHKIHADGTEFSLSQPDSGIGIINADSVQFNTYIGIQPGNSDSLSSISLETVRWSPPLTFQQQYGFFIQGFGYKTDSLPVENLNISYRYYHQNDSLIIENVVLNTDLFSASANGALKIDDQSFRKSRLIDVAVKVENPSPRFQNFLVQFQKLSGRQFSHDGKDIQFHLNGPVESPVVKFGQ